MEMLIKTKCTKATFKAFVRKYRSQLQIKVRSTFNGMTDGVEENKNAEFHPIVANDREITCEHTLGICGVWLVGGGRDWFEAWNDGNELQGCCH